MRDLPEFVSNPDPMLYINGWSAAVTLDFETTNIEKGTALNPENQIVLACWKLGSTTYSRRGNEMEMGALVRACNEASYLIAHNAKFELQWLERCGYDIGSRPVFDTMVGEWVINGNLNVRYDLNSSCARWGLPSKDDAIKRLMDADVCPSDIPPALLERYCHMDVDLTRRLAYLQLRKMQEKGLLPVMYTRCLVTPVLADIEKHGLHLDRERVEEEYAKTATAFEECITRMDEIAPGVNPQSPPQVAKFVYGELGFDEKCDRKGNPIRNKPTKQFPDGLPKTDEDTLLSLNAKTDRQKDFIKTKKQQAKLSSALNKNLSMFLGAVREKAGMIYASINQCRTVTHRLASSGRSTYFKLFDAKKGCQFQNMPRKYKRLFSARHDDWYIAEADGSQLEFRVAGHVGNEPKIRMEVEEGYDVHRFTAATLNGITEDEVNYQQRTAAKADTFKPLYGGKSGTRAQQRYYQAFQEKYDSLTFAQEGWCIEVANKKELVTEWGMRFYFPYAKYTGRNKDYLNVRTKVFNIPIQSFATADIIPIGMVCFWHRARQLRMLMVNTVHDSIVCEFPKEERKSFETIALQALTHDVYSYLDKCYDVQFSVNLGVGLIVGKYWGEPLEGEDEVSIEVPTPFNEREKRKIA